VGGNHLHSHAEIKSPFQKVFKWQVNKAKAVALGLVLAASRKVTKKS